MGVVLCYNEANAEKKVFDGGIIPDEKEFKKYIEDEEKRYRYDKGILNVVGSNPSLIQHTEFNSRGKPVTIIDIWWEGVKDGER